MHIHIERDGMVLDWDIADPKIAKEAVRAVAGLLLGLLKPDTKSTWPDIDYRGWDDTWKKGETL